MNAIEIQSVLGKRLTETPGIWAIGYPNKAAPPRPRIIIQNGASSNSTLGISRGSEVDAEISILVDGIEDQYSTAVDDQVKAIINQFPVGEVFDGVSIESAPSVRPPLPVEGGYAVPVIISGRSFY